MESLLESPSLVMLGEGPTHPGHLRRAIAESGATGNLTHDAHVATLALEHGVTELWTADRDFARFPGPSVRGPLADDAG